jgi:hypothetical protein
MLLTRIVDPSLFAFHHNGITLSAGLVEARANDVTIYEPRLLNGAQTVSTFADFWERNGPGLRASGGDTQVEDLMVLCRIVTHATIDTITQITISTNRQNPVLPWQLHANDQIQLQLEDWFRGLGIPYQRQDRAFAKVAAEDWQNLNLKETKAVELMKLARTYLTIEGELTKLAHIREVFEDEQAYKELFGPHRLLADPRKVILCYKALFRVGSLAREIAEKGKTKYAFVNRTREIVGALVCQAMLNDLRFEQFADDFGNDLSMKYDFVVKLREWASTRVRFILNDLLSDEEYAEKVDEGNFSFMRTTPAFRKAMKFAATEYKWKLITLRG